MWEDYQSGSLSLLLIDEGKDRGWPSRRMVYAGGGDPRVEVDRDGGGRFVPADADPMTSGTRKGTHASR